MNLSPESVVPHGRCRKVNAAENCLPGVRKPRSMLSGARFPEMRADIPSAKQG